VRSAVLPRSARPSTRLHWEHRKTPLWSREENILPRLEALDLSLPLLLESIQNLESPVYTEHQTGGQGMDIPSLETLRLRWCCMVTY
jgi:hypothetical protein